MPSERPNLPLYKPIGRKPQPKYKQYKKVYYSRVSYSIQTNYNGLIFNSFGRFRNPLSIQILVPAAAPGEGFKALSIFFMKPRKAFQKIPMQARKVKMLLCC